MITRQGSRQASQKFSWLKSMAAAVLVPVLTGCLALPLSTGTALAEKPALDNQENQENQEKADKQEQEHAEKKKSKADKLAKDDPTGKKTFQAQVSSWRESTDDEQPIGDITLSNQFPDKMWWENFHDPHLQTYIAEALASNHQLLKAKARLQEARALTQVTMANQMPTLSIGGNFTRSRNSKTIIPNPTAARANESSNSAGGGAAASGGSSSFLLGQFVNFYSVPLTASYEPDIWLKNRDRTRSARYSQQAVEQDLHTTTIALITDVANAYFNLIATDDLIDLQKQRILYSEANLNFSINRRDQGAASEEEVAIREGIVANENALLQNLNAQRAMSLNALAVLLGRSTQQVSELPRKPFSEYEMVNNVDVGVPSELIIRRPDILAEESRLTAARIDVSVARKEFLPSFNLNGQFGYSTIKLGQLFRWDSYVTSLATGLTQNLFTGGRKMGTLKATKARYEQAIHQYQQTILQSFREVDDSLAALKSSHRAYGNYQASVKALETRQTIVGNRVNEGVDSMADLVPIQYEAAQTKAQAAQAKLASLSNMLSLYKSLGGGY